MTAPPWHFWPVAILSLIWHAVAAADYLLTKLELAAYLSVFTADQVAYFTQMPLWADIAWAIGVWPGLLAAWLLWRRHAAATLLFAVSFAGLIVLTAGLVYLYPPGLYAVTGSVGVWLMLAATAAAFLFYLYARALHVRDRRG
ncbi:MAG: hypothetical protein QNJ16_20465 [Rhodobacter sp.]|nr:hypothetical protein [Rhodobacter sp.]